jgi:hypothetical protein
VAKASHLAWDNTAEREIPVCGFHADMIFDGRGGSRFDGSRPYVPATPNSGNVQCRFDCHRFGCHGAIKDDAEEIHAG